MQEENIKKPELVILVAVWDFLVAIFAFVALLLLSIFVFPPATGMAFGPALVGVILGLCVLALFLLGLLLVSVLGGIGLLRGREWGRALSLVVAALSVFALPVGTAAGVLIIVYLTRGEVRQYFSPVAPQSG